MKCEKVKLYLDEYIDGTLPEDISGEMKAHLADCKECKSEYKLLNNFLKKASQLRTGIKPPEDLLDRITGQLMKIPSETEDNKNKLSEAQVKKFESALKKELRKRKKSSAKVKKDVKKNKIVFTAKIKRIIWIFIAFIILFSGYYFYENSQNNSPWEIELISGSYSINGFETDTSELNEGELLSTANDTQLRINIPGKGFGIINDNSSILLVKAKNNGNIVKLNSGSIKIEDGGFQTVFELQTYFARIIDFGSNFNVTFIDDNKIELEVQNGQIKLESGGESLELIVDHICSISEINGISVPYHINSAIEFKQALFAFELDKKNIFSLNTLLSFAEEYNALTLWSLLSITDSSNRGRILYELQSFFPLPANVTSMGILAMDNKMLNLYWDEIEWQLQR